MAATWSYPLTGRLGLRRLGGMDDVSRLVAPPAPTPEQLAEWQLVADRVDHGDDGDLIEWEKIAVELDLA